MANHESAKKRARQSVKRNERNKARKTQARTMIKTIREAISKQQKDQALKLIPILQKTLGKLAKLGIIHKNAAANKTSRLSSQAANL